MKGLQVDIKGPFTLESSFTTHWLKILKDKGFYTDKISDASIGTKKIDCYIGTLDDKYCCEIKVIDSDMFPLSRLRPNQWKALQVWMENNGSSIVVVYSKKYNAYKIIPFEKLVNLDRTGKVKLVF